MPKEIKCRLCFSPGNYIGVKGRNFFSILYALYNFQSKFPRDNVTHLAALRDLSSVLWGIGIFLKVKMLSKTRTNSGTIIVLITGCRICNILSIIANSHFKLFVHLIQDEYMPKGIVLLKNVTKWRNDEDLRNVEDERETDDRTHVSEEEAAVADSCIPVIVIVSQTDRLRLSYG